jgi:hypothetical protein
MVVVTKVALTLVSLAQHWREGLAERMFAKELAKVVHDMKAAPDIKKARRVTMHVDLVPANLTDGSLDDVAIGVQVVSKTPARTAAGTMIVGLGQNTNLTFEADLPDSDPYQRPLFEGPPDAPRQREPGGDQVG